MSWDAGFEADGIVGLGYLSTTGLSFIQSLKSAGTIPQAVFSVFINDNYYENDDLRKPHSTVVIGGYDFESYSDGSSPVTYKVHNSSSGLWALKLDAVWCRDTKIDYNSEYAVLDTLSSKIIGPQDSVQILFDRFEAMYGCGYYRSSMVCDCSEIYSIVKFPSITFEFGGKTYTLSENSYFKKTSKTCYLMFEGSNIDYWILGQPFLRQYYTVYDLDSFNITLVGAHSSLYSADVDSNWWIIPVVLIIGAFVVGIGWLAWVYYKKYSGDTRLSIEQEARG